jgi:hypothetical protein
MLRNMQVCLLVVMSMILSLLLGGCGSSNKEGVTANVAQVDEATCRVCHSTSIDPVSKTQLLPEYLNSVHNTADRGCQGCHGGGAQHNGVGPIPYPDPLAADRCNNASCHNNGAPSPAVARDFVGNCARCHAPNGDTTNPETVGLHGAQLIDTAIPTKKDDCIYCHSVAAPQHGVNRVGDNQGVRAVVTEFSKWSHHVTGVTLNPAHCAVCHLEGTVVDGQIVMDDSKHMADNSVHLRNVSDDSEFTWTPDAPNHTTMDNFCMTCHSATGATSPMSVKIQAVINANGINAAGKTASALNPFGDTISNRYDKMQRPAVVDVSDQFNTDNNSHHGVKGPRYSGRTRLAGPRQIASPSTFANNSSQTLQGARSTIFDAGNFNANYVPLENTGGEAAPRTGAAGLGDDSTLHCGDCHTVGQWKPGSSVSADGKPTPVAIGAHGSNNEYLLRNSIGTDERHTQNAFTTDAANNVTYTNPDGAFLVCYNCHAYNKYGSIFLQTGVVGGHVGEYDAAGRCNGIGNTLPFNGYTTGTATDGTQFESRFEGPISKFSSPAPYAGEQNPDFGNIFGIQCLNCHNSNGFYGGIHGSRVNTYTDGMGNTTKVERFLPGLGNAKHVPGTLGGFTGGVLANYSAAGAAADYTYTTGGVSNDANWEQKHWQQTPTTVINNVTGAASNTASAGAGCYTLGENQDPVQNVTASQQGPSVTGEGGPATQMFGTWGGCDDHTARQGGGNHGFVKKIIRPVTY